MATDQNQYIFIWQGGEPTLMGNDFFKKVVELQKKFGKQGAVVSNVLQTNGTLINDALAEHLFKYRFLVGISIDGPKKLHDKYRKNVAEKGTHDAVLKGIECLKRNRIQFNVIVLVNNNNVAYGRTIYQYLRNLECYHQQYIPCVEFVGNRSSYKPKSVTITGKQWGNFLCEIFDEWRLHDTREVSVRLFDSVMNFYDTGETNICSMKKNCNSYFMVEYNGDVYPCDFYADPHYKLGNISKNSWEEIQNSPKYFEFTKKKLEWHKTCCDCSYLKLCAGDCPRNRIPVAGDNDSRAYSWLCDGWKKFYLHTISEFKRLARTSQVERQKELIKKQRDTNKYRQIRSEKIGRNVSCVCGSGKKYKKCCGKGIG